MIVSLEPTRMVTKLHSKSLKALEKSGRHNVPGRNQRQEVSGGRSQKCPSVCHMSTKPDIRRHSWRTFRIEAQAQQRELSACEECPLKSYCESSMDVLIDRNKSSRVLDGASGHKIEVREECLNSAGRGAEIWAWALVILC